MISRGDDKVNVPVSESDLLFTAELLKALSVEQAWSSYKNADGTEAGEDTVPADEAADTSHCPETTAETAPVPMEKGGGALLDSITGTIKSVRKDRKGFCIGDTWYKAGDNTELGIDLNDAKGKNVTVYYTPGNGDNANPVALRVVTAA